MLHAGEFAGDDVGHIAEHEDEGLGIPTEDVADLIALDAHVHEGTEIVAVRKRVRELPVERRHMQAADDIPLCRLFGEEALLRHVIREEHDDVPVGICTPAEDKVRRTIHRVHLAADALLPKNRMKLRELGRRKEACMREIVAVIGFFREVADAALEKCILIHKSFSVLLYVRPMQSAGRIYLREKSPAAGGFPYCRPEALARAWAGGITAGRLCTAAAAPGSDRPSCGCRRLRSSFCARGHAPGGHARPGRRCTG